MNENGAWRERESDDELPHPKSVNKVSTRKTSNPRWRAKLLLLGASLLLALTSAEVALRLVGFSSPVFSQTDPVTGRSLWPGARGWQTREGRAYVQINSDGMRDREFSVTKQDRCSRIAVLGDSFAEAMQVKLEDSFPKALERLLNETDSGYARHYEVLNFGVSGYGTGSQLLTLRHKVWKYDPDIVLLAMFTGNDIRNNSRFLSDGFDAKRPYFLRDATGEIIVDNSFRESSSWESRRRLERWGISSVFNRSAVLQLVRHARLYVSNGRARTVVDRWDEPGVEQEVFAPPQTDAWREAWAVTEALLRTMHREVKEHGATLIVVTLSNGIQVHPDSRLRAEFMTAMKVEDVFYPDRRVAEFCRANGIAVVTLAPPLQTFADRTGKYLHGFANAKLGGGHWNEEGHKAAARLMAPAIRDLIDANGSPMYLASPAKKDRR